MAASGLMGFGLMLSVEKDPFGCSMFHTEDDGKFFLERSNTYDGDYLICVKLSNDMDGYTVGGIPESWWLL